MTCATSCITAAVGETPGAIVEVEAITEAYLHAKEEGSLIPTEEVGGFFPTGTVNGRGGPATVTATTTAPTPTFNPTSTPTLVPASAVVEAGTGALGQSVRSVQDLLLPTGSSNVHVNAVASDGGNLITVTVPGTVDHDHDHGHDQDRGLIVQASGGGSGGNAKVFSYVVTGGTEADGDEDTSMAVEENRNPFGVIYIRGGGPDEEEEASDDDNTVNTTGGFSKQQEEEYYGNLEDRMAGIVRELEETWSKYEDLKENYQNSCIEHNKLVQKYDVEVFQTPSKGCDDDIKDLKKQCKRYETLKKMQKKLLRKAERRIKELEKDRKELSAQKPANKAKRIAAAAEDAASALDQQFAQFEAMAAAMNIQDDDSDDDSDDNDDDEGEDITVASAKAAISAKPAAVIQEPMSAVIVDKDIEEEAAEMEDDKMVSAAEHLSKLLQYVPEPYVNELIDSALDKTPGLLSYIEDNDSVLYKRVLRIHPAAAEAQVAAETMVETEIEAEADTPPAANGGRRGKKVAAKAASKARAKVADVDNDDDGGDDDVSKASGAASTKRSAKKTKAEAEEPIRFSRRRADMIAEAEAAKAKKKEEDDKARAKGETPTLSKVRICLFRFFVVAAAQHSFSCSYVYDSMTYHICYMPAFHLISSFISSRKMVSLPERSWKMQSFLSDS